MNSIQAEYLRQASMAQQFGQGIPVVPFYRTAPMAFDSFGSSQKSSGGFIKSVLLIAGAIIFRKNIANVTKRYFPGFAKGVGRIFKDLRGAAGKLKGSEYVAKGWQKYERFERQTSDFVHDSFKTKSGKKVAKKANELWDWLKGIFLKETKTKKLTSRK